MIFNSQDEIFAVLDETRLELDRRIKGLNETQLATRENEEGWSVQELVEHLSMVERSVIGIVDRLLAKSEELNVSPGADGKIDPPVKFTSRVRRTDMEKVQAPERIRPQGDIPVTESLEKLEESRRYIKSLRPRMAAVDLSNAKFPHAMLGELSLYQWLLFVSQHEARHLAQIENILKGHSGSSAAAL
jgi:hypothetical protein